MIAWQIIHNDSHDLKKDGVIVIPQSFEGNALSITLDTREYENNREILGWLYQYSGQAIKRYPIFTGDEVLSLIIPATDSLKFFPTTYLSLQYGLKIAYANIANGATGAGVSTSIPSIILGLPDRVTALEAIPPVSLTSANTAITALQQSDTSQNNSIGAIQTNVSNLSTEVSNLRATSASASAIAYTLVTANQALESGKKYLATSSGLICSLPSSAAIGDVISLSTGNFNFRANHGNATHQILNLSTLTVVGTSSGIILKPYSDIDLVFLGGNLWKTTYRTRTINNFQVETLTQQPIAVTLSTTSGASAYGTTLNSMRDGVKTTGGALTTGYLADRNFLNLLITANSSFILNQIKLWNGQANNTQNGASTYRVSGVTIYRGNSNAGVNLGAFTFTNNTGIEQSRDIVNNTQSNTYFLAFTAPSAEFGILELEIYGLIATGGEIVAI